MKIACITSSQIPSSTANSIQAMKAVHALAQVSGSVQLWAPGTESVSWETLAAHYGLVQPFPIQWEPTQQLLKRYDLALKTVHQARAWGADLVYTWMPQVAVMAQVQRMPAILEMHDLPTGRIGPHLFRQFVQAGGKKRLLVITHALLRKLEGEYSFQLSPEQVQVAPNGTEMERYAALPSPEEARRQLGLAPGLTVGYTGHFYAGRGTEMLLYLVRTFPQVHFLLVGGTPDKVQSWQAQMQKEGIHNTHAAGFVENARLPLYQAAADVLLMPYERSIAGSSGGNSADICSPMKMFDYLACGRAILTSDLPVLHEVLNEANAVFCPPEDPSAWERALFGVLQNADLRQRLSDQAHRDAERYSWKERARRAIEGF
jgi:glycosyltransferase involved in cell wall biosynthesis